MAIGGSTNAVVHLTAIAGRLGIRISTERLNEHLRRDAGAGRPEAGRRRLHGGLPRRRRHGRRCCANCAPLLHLRHHRRRRPHAGRAPGRSRSTGWTARVIRPFDDPVSPVGGLSRCTGSLAPGRRDLQARRRHARPCSRREGRAVVFTGLEDLARPHRRPGPRRAARRHPGAAERRPAGGGHAGGRLPADPEEAGAGRREGHGAHLRRAHVAAPRSAPIVLHVAPEAAVGGPLARGARRRPHPAVGRATSASTCWSTPAEIARRLAGSRPPPAPARGYKALYRRTVTPGARRLRLRLPDAGSDAR